MITHAHHLAAQPPIFAAPLVAILAGIVGDIPRYQRENGVVSFSRPSPEGEPVMSKEAIALQSRISDVVKAAPLVLDLLDRKRMDANAITEAVQSKRSTAYKALYYMLDVGTVGRVVHHRACVEWVVA